MPKKLWEVHDTALVPVTARKVEELVPFAQQLSSREGKQIVDAFNAGSYEMMASFVWTKAMAALRRHLASLGMEFIGEMLGRQDIDDSSLIDRSVTDFEAIKLAADLGMIGATEALRMSQTLQTVSHFAHQSEHDEESAMAPEEALLCLRASIQSILGLPKIQVATSFSAFRNALETTNFQPDDREISDLADSPYLFRRTTLSVLLAMARTADGAQLEHALANINVILPILWENLRKTERWQTGQTYAEVYSAGRSVAAGGLRKALGRVQGFDYVPENLRSNTFSLAAQKVIEGHESFNNFYNEAAPLKALSDLGTSIPIPAFPVCMTAIMCIRLGNPYGHTFAADATTLSLLQGLPRERWEYYLNECLPGDLRILHKLQSSKPRARWQQLVELIGLTGRDLANKTVRKLLAATSPMKEAEFLRCVQELIGAQGYASA